MKNGENTIKNPPERAAALNLKVAVSAMDPVYRKSLYAGYDANSLKKVFANEGLMTAVNAFLENGMNLSLTARSLYMHRNTLIYKLNAVKKITGFDMRDFGCALTFKILHIIYMLDEV